MSKREAVCAAFATRLGASRDPRRLALEDAPFKIVEDRDETATQGEYRHIVCTMTVRAESFDLPSVGESRSTATNRLLASLIAAATGSDLTLGGLADDIAYDSGGPLLLTDPVEQVGAFAEFSILYRYDAGDPETLTE